MVFLFEFEFELIRYTCSSKKYHFTTQGQVNNKRVRSQADAVVAVVVPSTWGSSTLLFFSGDSPSTTFVLTLFSSSRARFSPELFSSDSASAAFSTETVVSVTIVSTAVFELA